jgi:hypothetical protein
MLSNVGQLGDVLRQRISVPLDVVEVLRWHVRTQLATAEHSGSRSCSFPPRTAACDPSICSASRSPASGPWSVCRCGSRRTACAGRSTIWRAPRRWSRSSRGASAGTSPNGCARITEGASRRAAREHGASAAARGPAGPRSEWCSRWCAGPPKWCSRRGGGELSHRTYCRPAEGRTRDPYRVKRLSAILARDTA